MVNSIKKRRARMLLVIDLIAVFLSYIIASWLRYGSQTAQWQLEIYRMLVAAVILINVILYLYRERSSGAAGLVAKDPIDNFIHVFKNVTILLMGVAGVLFVSQMGQRISRLLLGYFYLTDIVLDYILRMLFRAVLKRHAVKVEATRRILIVTVSYLSKIAIQHLRSAQDDDIEIAGMALLDSSRLGNAISGVAITENRETLKEKKTANGAFTEAYLYLPYSRPEEINEVLQWFENMGVDAYLALSSFEDDYTESIIEKFGVYRAALYSSMKERCKVLGVNFVVANVDSAVMYIRKHIHELKGKYICFCNVHTTVMAHDDPDYRRVQNNSAYTFADGMPVAKAQHLKGFPKGNRVAGPDFMNRMFIDTMDGKLTHYFYGSTQETLDQLAVKLKEKYPGIVIKGMYSPPFRELTPEEDQADVDRINAAGADIIWVGLGAPKQEKWMAAHEGRVNGMMAGVGAGFNFHAGTVKRAPAWMQRISMEWFYRLMQEPGKLLKRYFITNSKFVIYLAGEILFHTDKDKMITLKRNNK